jgi:TetR/AcrR family transcriptional regulator, tetracycline repressor protein
MTAAVRRPYGELDRARVVASLRNLVGRVGVQGVTMRELAAELGAAVPSVYYHVPGIAGILQTSGGGESARRLDRLSRTMLAEAGLAKAAATAAHSVLYTYLLGSISLEETRSVQRGKRQAANRFRAGLDVIIAGIKASLENR